MQKDLDKLSNQSRFIKMIIDGTLVVSKKKKSILVEELTRSKFKRFPKVSQAKKMGEMEDAQEDENDVDEEAGLSDFDYLLGVSTIRPCIKPTLTTFSRWLSGR
ncbi:hypothetical protein EJ05DRAFT_475814 [Pseudovirgaria hyperparasitica]|uniref:DNA topoisomerase (ATP-hydrolyzing) n=1 Tax=Pseudovirgaria hyperparasitica TaxID=470096 RepID=A0A6A6WA91_9PEZI|nr:uncharacterized protein EJ05DRAFT_475814 [Pseudovirgaria hyperparasitica]KAF2758507.1 hypothetical protein EJ05DRAFT_475814 [Pseudovirgaria hyperparasitica]